VREAAGSAALAVSIEEHNIIGGLGSAAAQYLGAAGVGRIGLIDPDIVALPDLHRQVIHIMAELGTPKVFSAERALRSRNPEIRVDCYPEKLSAENVIDLISLYDFVLDCSDNFPTRFLVNDACYFAHRPLVSGSVFQFGGQVTTFLRVDNGPCYRCLYPEAAPEEIVPPAEESGVSGIAAGVIGLLQANEALKIITGVGQLLHGRLLIFDGLTSFFRTVKVRKNTECPLCGVSPTIKDLSES